MPDYTRNSIYDKKLLHSECSFFASAYYFKQWDSYKMDVHAHDRVEIMYAISGSCRIQTKNRINILRKGDFILLDADVPHSLSLETNEKCRMLNVEFGFRGKLEDFPSVGQIINSNPSLKNMYDSAQPYIVLKDTAEVYQALKSLILELDTYGDDKSMNLQMLFSQLLIRIARLYADSASDDGQGMLYTRKALNYIHQHYDYPIKVKDIADAVNIHQAYLHRLFKANSGVTINEYLLQTRMEKAKVLLRNTDINITEICSYIGINSSQYFAQTFKKYTGVSPTAYRNSVDKQRYAVE